MNPIRRGAAWSARRLAGHLAGRALTAAVYGDCTRGHEITADVIERGGRNAVRAVAGVWCEAICAGMPRRVRRRARPFRPYFGTVDGAAVTVEEAPPVLRWTAQLIAAHAGLDWDMCRALVDAVPDDEIQDHLAVLLHTAATAVAGREVVL